ncbi:hypothetical protein BS78_K275100 [Paspalum vaginatum]|uniref:Cytochrome P450 n=1 Tax=Paspalum vaginatum TaxID=158149 RepID=A0A9W7XE52_9POAL|nr:hypothetical protein BS78_K275100 [Paspalum vaginatum]
MMFAVVCIALSLSLLYWWTNKARCKSLGESLQHHRRLPPGPDGLPVIGSILHMVWNRPVYRWVHRLLEEMNTDILCLRFGAVHVVVVTSPEIAREVLRKNDAVFASRPVSFTSESFSLGYKGVTMSPYGEQWKKMRRVLTREILSPSMERLFQRRREEEADHLIRFVYSRCSSGSGAPAANDDGGLVNIRYVAQHFCANTIRTLMFGRRHLGSGDEPILSSFAGPEEEAHLSALLTLVGYVFNFTISDYIPAWIGLDIDGQNKVVKGVMKTLNRLHDPIIQGRIHEWSAGLVGRSGGDDDDDNDNRDQTSTCCRDFLDVLVSLRDSEGLPLLSPDEIRAATVEIQAASIDNPSNALEWVLAEMMNRPEVMQKAISELDRVVGKERLVQESDIPRLNYLKSCIREAFRLHPYHAFNLPHVAMEDTTLSGYLVPKGSHVLVSRLELGRNTDTWDAPLEFRPERHMAPDVLLAEPDLRFVSFSTGRRGCPGMSLGSTVTMMLFARLLHGFTWSMPPGLVHPIQLKESATDLALAEPLCLKPQPRLPEHIYPST